MEQELHSHTLIFDTNVFRVLISNKNEHIFKAFFVDLNKKFNTSNLSYRACVTPMLLLEYFGTVPSRFPEIVQLPEELVESDLSRDLPPYIYKESLRQFKQLPELDEIKFKNRYLDQKKYISPAAEKFFTDLVGRFVVCNGSYKNPIAEQLALDFCYGYNYSAFVNDADLIKIHAKFILDVLRGFKNKLNLSQARGMFEVQSYLSRLLKKIGVPNPPEDAKEGLKLFGDRGDLDLLHMAVIGVFLDEIHYPTIVLTADPMDSVIKRIKAYKSIVQIFVSTMVEASETNPEVKEFFGDMATKSGSICIFNVKTGLIDNIINVSEL